MVDDLTNSQLLMRHLTSVLLDWLRLPQQVLLLCVGDRNPESPKLQSHAGLARDAVIAWVSLRRDGETRPVAIPLPTIQGRPLWANRQQLEQLLDTMDGTNLARVWLDNMPGRWGDLLDSVRWTMPSPLPDTLSSIREWIRQDTRTRGLPAALLAEQLLVVLLDSKPHVSVGHPVLSDASLEEALELVRLNLDSWTDATERRRTIRTLCLPEGTLQRLFAEGESSIDVENLVRPMPSSTPSPSTLLDPMHTVVPFHGRRAELAELARWCAEPQKQQVRLLYGSEGIGKTRIAIALCDVVRRCGWAAGFLPNPLREDWKPGEGDRLVIIDENRTWTPELHLHLARAAEQPGRLRLLFLSRATGSWWSEFQGAGADTMTLVPMREDSMAHFQLAASVFAHALGRRMPWILDLPDLSAERFGWPLVLQATAMATLDGIAPVNTVELASRLLEWERKRWSLEDERRLAFATLRGSSSGLSPRWLGDQLVNEMLEKEENFLEEAFGEAISSEDVSAGLRLLSRLASQHPHAKAWLIELVAIRPEVARDVAAQLARPAGRPSLAAPVELHESDSVVSVAPMWELAVTFRRQILSPWQPADRSHQNGRSGGVKAPSMSGRIWDLIRDTIDVLLPHQVRALESLNQPEGGSSKGFVYNQWIQMMHELVQHHPDAHRVHLGIAVNDLGALLVTDDLYPEPRMIPLSEAALASLRRARGLLADAETLQHRKEHTRALTMLLESMELLQGLVDRFPGQADAEFLHASINTASVLQAMGQPEQAIAMLKTHRYPSDISRSTIALLLALFGKPFPAVQLARDAVVSSEARAQNQEPARLLEVVCTLHTLAAICDAADRAAHSQAALQGAIRVGRSLTGQGLSLFRAHHAAALTLTSTWMTARSQGSLARSYRRRAASTLHEMTGVRPDLFSPFIGLSLNNIGSLLQGDGERNAALDATIGAIEAYRAQARSRGEAFLPDLANALNNLGAMLQQDQRELEAVEMYRKALGICWGGISPDDSTTNIETFLVQKSSKGARSPIGLSLRGRQRAGTSRCRPYFMWNIRLLADDMNSGKQELASRTRWGEQPQELRALLGSTLLNLGALLGNRGQFETSMEALSGAVAAFRDLQITQPDLYELDLAIGLNNLGVLLGVQGKHEEAVDLLQESVALFREMVENRRDESLSDLAMGLNNLGAAYNNLGSHEIALEMTREATELCDEVARKDPLPALPALGKSLHNFGFSLYATGQVRLAVTAHREAIRAVATAHRQGIAIPSLLPMVQTYQEHAAGAGVEVDQALLDSLPVLR